MIKMLTAPEHLKDLKKSGLSDDTIREAGIKSVPPDQFNKKLGFNMDGLVSMYEIPFDEEYSRFKAFYEDGKAFNKDGSKKPKYMTKKDSYNRLYIPSKVTTILGDVSIPIDITEGEKKALKACQEGLYCVGITGLWNWKVKGENRLIQDFDRVALEGRTVCLVPDNDWQKPDRKGERKNLKQAVNELAYLLIDRGAKVYWRELPQGEDKVGLDDYLCNHSVEELKQLPVREVNKLTLDEMLEKATPDTLPDEVQKIVERIASINKESEQSLYINKLKEKTGISKRAISSDMKKYAQQGSVEPKSKQKLCANFPGLIDVVVDDTKEDGSTLFMVKEGNKIHYTAEWEMRSGKCYIPPSQEFLPFILPRVSKVKEWYQSDNDTQLFKDLIAYFKRFSYLPDEQLVVVICNVFLTYIQDHKDVDYLPMLLFWAVPERGKSRTGKTMTYVCFRGIHVVELREANLFRYSQDMKATLFFDIMNLWRTAETSKTSDILLLRYEKGAKVSRVLFPDKGPFEDMEHYDIYGSTIMATNEAVHKILDSRCIPITMPNKPSSSYEDPKPEKALELKERLTAWRARILERPLLEIGTIEGLSGRLWDISRPMLQVCKLLYSEGINLLKKALLEVASQKIEDKKTGIEGQIIEAIDELSLDKKILPEWEILQSELLRLLNGDRPAQHQLTPQYLGKKLKAIGIKTRKVHGYAEAQLKKSEFDILLAQYGIIEPPPPTETLPNATTLPSNDIDNKEPGHLVESGRELQGGIDLMEIEI